MSQMLEQTKSRRSIRKCKPAMAAAPEDLAENMAAILAAGGGGANAAPVAGPRGPLAVRRGEARVQAV